MKQISQVHTGLPVKKNKGLVCWPVLVVATHPALHDDTRLMLNDYTFLHKPIRLFHAGSAAEAKTRMEQRDDFVIILLDVGVENQTDGIDLIHWIRNISGNKRIQIVIQSATADSFSALDIIENFDINHYLVKQEITAHKLQRLVSIAIRNYLDRFEFEEELIRRQKMQQSLQEKENLLEDIIENIGDILWETDKNLCYSYVSKKAESLTGYQIHQFIGQPFGLFFTQESDAVSLPVMRERMDLRQRFSNIEISRTSRNGDIQYYLVSAKPFFRGQTFMGYRGVDIHITELKHAQKEKEKLMTQLRQAQRLEAMGTLAGGIAHDFNNILGGILGFAQLLQFELKENETCLSYSNQIVNGCNRAKSLIFQILDFSRQSEQATGKHLANPVEIVTETAKLLKASFPSSIKISCSINPETGCIKADPSQIHQAVLNLCTNAGQAIETGRGKVSITVDEISHSFEHPIRNLKLDLPFGDYIMIRVEDDGKGIEINDLGKIFNPYFTTKQRGSGTGLGLSVVHGIVTRFNGAITTQTQPGQGTVFTLYFPRHSNPETSTRPQKSRVIMGDANILFIDDEPMLVQTGQMMLEKLGYTVCATESADQAIEILKNNPDKFDLVITDMTMPKIHGTQVARNIKKINPSIVVVLATGHTTISHPNSDKIEGVDAILPKPIEVNMLSQTLHQLLRPASSKRPPGQPLPSS